MLRDLRSQQISLTDRLQEYHDEEAQRNRPPWYPMIRIMERYQAQMRQFQHAMEEYIEAPFNAASSHTILLAQDISQATIDSQLTVAKGDIADVSAIKNALYTSTKDNATPRLASTIVSGIGGAPKLQKSSKNPKTIDNPEICATAICNILQALHETSSASGTPGSHDSKPTTGLSDIKEDVLLGFRTLYRTLLAALHAYKETMERIIDEHMAVEAQEQCMLRSAVVVRASLLKGDHLIESKSLKGYKAFKVGTEENPAIGYTVHRVDVGNWIYEEVVRTGGSSFVGEKVTLTD
ncbi:hypothetical protein BGW42_005884 [Actinomortierella wolfii]|nr:hypothetical protein BGW42_005884 [Actinomortierella wolfii]